MICPFSVSSRSHYSQLEDPTSPFLPAALLLHPDRITTTDCPTAHHGSIHTDVDLVMLGRRAQDSRIPREIRLRESRHHATPAGAGDVQAHRGPDSERVTDQAFSAKPFSSETNCTTMFGRNRRTS